MVPTNPIIIATEQSDAQPAVTGDAAGRVTRLAAERRGNSDNVDRHAVIAAHADALVQHLPSVVARLVRKDDQHHVAPIAVQRVLVVLLGGLLKGRRHA